MSKKILVLDEELIADLFGGEGSRRGDVHEGLIKIYLVLRGLENG